MNSFNFTGYWSDTSVTNVLPIVFSNGVFTDIPYTTGNPSTDTFYAKVDGVEFVENNIDVAYTQSSGFPDSISIVASKSSGDNVGLSIAQSLPVGTYQFAGPCSDLAGLDEKASSGDLVAYIGFDCTAPSLHVGSLVQIMMLRWLQKTGNKPIALMGGGTTRVGDPSGRDETRKILTLEDIESNKLGIQGVFDKIITFGAGKTDAMMIDNAEWLTRLNYIDMLRDIGRHFSVNRMMSMDSVKLRLERDQELSFIEFNYMCLQAYDFVELNRR